MRFFIASIPRTSYITKSSNTVKPWPLQDLPEKDTCPYHIFAPELSQGTNSKLTSFSLLSQLTRSTITSNYILVKFHCVHWILPPIIGMVAGKTYGWAVGWSLIWIFWNLLYGGKPNRLPLPSSYHTDILNFCEVQPIVLHNFTTAPILNDGDADSFRPIDKRRQRQTVR